MEKRTLSSYSSRQLGVLYALWLAMFALILRRAWVGEDAYITFRVIDNFIHGYGLRWNIEERVQVYTHPLWLLLHLPFAMVAGNIFLVNIFLSVTCTSGALLVALYTAKKPVLITLGCFFLPLLLSKSFMDYSTSGLENPLSYLLFALFGHILLKKREQRYFWFYLSLCTALAALNRLDMFVLYAPIVAYTALRPPSPIRWMQIMTGFLPLLAWFVFAFFYYGFLFPNTKYAKLNTGLSEWLYLSQGLQYAKFLLVLDMSGALLILSTLFFILRPNLFSLVASKDGLPRAVAIGIIAYCLYVIAIGGDYMVGRFWSVPVFAAAWLWLMACPARPARPDKFFLAVCLLLCAHGASAALNSIRNDCDSCVELKKKIINATVTFRSNRFITDLYPLTIQSEGHYKLAERGRKLLRTDRAPVTSASYVGMEGYYAGPTATIIDELGLADPLLARLPASQEQNFYIGHFKRILPKGYINAVKTGSLDGMNESLAHYYEKLHIITSAPLLDRERLKTIIEFNLGYFDYWKEDYLHHAT